MKPETFLKEAIALSEEGMKENRGGPFGALIVKDGKVIGRGQNLVTSTFDPTAHAEICAIRKACSVLRSFSLTGCTLFSSCEPCPMCLAAAYWARIDKIYYAARRRDAASIGFDDEWIYKELALPKELRALPMEEKFRDDALLIFDEWKMKQDKIVY